MKIRMCACDFCFVRIVSNFELLVLSVPLIHGHPLRLRSGHALRLRANSIASMQLSRSCSGSLLQRLHHESARTVVRCALLTPPSTPTMKSRPGKLFLPDICIHVLRSCSRLPPPIQADQASNQYRQKKLPSDPFDDGQAARQIAARHDVAVAESGECDEAKVERAHA